jgi:glutamate 5-kinase
VRWRAWAQFSYFDESVAQVLVNDRDVLESANASRSLRATVFRLLELGVLPIFNANDVLSQHTEPLRSKDSGKIYWDNDTLAIQLAEELNVDAVIMLGDYPGLAAPGKNDGINPTDGDQGAVLDYTTGEVKDWAVSNDSRVSPEGQLLQITACVRSLKSTGVQAVVIASAFEGPTLTAIMAGETVGTFIRTPATSKL